eukprot:4305668-Amphidinium_carterae.1
MASPPSRSFCTAEEATNRPTDQSPRAAALSFTCCKPPSLVVQADIFSNTTRSAATVIPAQGVS